MPGNRSALGVIFAPVTKFSLLFCPTRAPHVPRRAFLRYAGATSAGAALLLAGCKKDDPQPTTVVSSNGESVALGSGDIALLNLLQAGKQLSTDLLNQLLRVSPAVLTGSELALIRDMQAQQKVQRDALKAAVNATRLVASTPALNLPDLPSDFSAVDFTQRATALAAAHTLLDTLVAGAAGSLRYTSRGAIMTLIGQVLSVDARHAATLGSLLASPVFTDPQEAGSVTDSRNRSLRPQETATALNTSIKSGSRLLTNNLA